MSINENGTILIKKFVYDFKIHSFHISFSSNKWFSAGNIILEPAVKPTSFKSQ